MQHDLQGLIDAAKARGMHRLLGQTPDGLAYEIRMRRTQEEVLVGDGEGNMIGTNRFEERVVYTAKLTVPGTGSVEIEDGEAHDLRAELDALDREVIAERQEALQKRSEPA